MATEGPTSNKNADTHKTPYIELRSLKNEEKPDARNDPVYLRDSRHLRSMLRAYMYEAFEWKDGVCSIHLVYCFTFLVQIAKICFITTQMFDFGHLRAHFSSEVNSGHLTLRHLLLKNWDAEWETLPYPPAKGAFAVYTIENLVHGINFAVDRYYNVDKYAIGHYVRTEQDKMKIRLKYFDLPDSNADNALKVNDKIFDIDKGLTISNTSNGALVYSYDILEELGINCTQQIKRMLAIILEFNIHSVRVVEAKRQARCLSIQGNVTYQDIDNNGQVDVDLKTLTKRVNCTEMNLTVHDWVLEPTSTSKMVAMITFCLISIFLASLTSAFAVFAFVNTKWYMRKHYRTFYRPLEENETDLPALEYVHLFQIWDLVALLSDVLTIYATIWITVWLNGSGSVLEDFDSSIICLGAGCVLAWLNLLRYFKFNRKFNLLFSTLYGAFWDVMAYLLCVGILFLAFWVYGVVVMGPYHVKFRTPAAATETLFALVQGDEIYATMAMLETDKIGGDHVALFFRIYIGAYVAIFTIVVINLLIAIFMSSYEAIKAYYDTVPEERGLGRMEKALCGFLDTNGDHYSLRSSLYEVMRSQTECRSSELANLRKELARLMSVTAGEVVVRKPRTLKAFIEGDNIKRKVLDCKFFKCSFVKFTPEKET